MLCSSTQPTKVPYFNAPIYLENKTPIGKVDEILGPINEVYFTIKMNEGMGERLPSCLLFPGARSCIFGSDGTRLSLCHRTASLIVRIVQSSITQGLRQIEDVIWAEP